MFWNKELTYWITPKSGPMRGMATLIDANHAISRDLPSGYLKRVHWTDVANLLVQAAESGHDDDVRIATDELVHILRTAFTAVLRDPDFLVEARLLRIDVTPQAGEEIQRIVGALHAAPRQVVERLKQIVEP